MNTSHRFIWVLGVSAAVLCTLTYGYLVFDKKPQQKTCPGVMCLNPAVDDWGSPPNKDDPNKYVVKSRVISQGVIEVDFDTSLLLTATEVEARERWRSVLNCAKHGCPGVVVQK